VHSTEEIVRYLSRGLAAFLVSSVMLAALPLQASAQSNSVTITIAGGDATAIAACVNVAKERGPGGVEQENKCKNIATAIGGDVTLKDVKIIAVATSDEKPEKKNAKKDKRPDNSVTITITGGDAKAIAACVNAASEKGPGGVEQENKCVNDAFARGGDVKLKNVKIVGVARGRG